MRFDAIIGNPPYLKDTFLKISEMVINHSDNIVFIQPTKWLEDPLKEVKTSSNSYYFKYKESVGKHIASLDILDPVIKESFGVKYYGNLGIYVFTKDGGFDYKNFHRIFISKKNLQILDSLSTSNVERLLSKIEKNKIDGIRVPLTDIAGNRGKLPIYKEIIYAVDGKVQVENEWKDWTLCKNWGGYDKEEGSPMSLSIKFCTIKEAINFYDSIKTDWYRNLCNFLTLDQNIPTFFLPWMGDTINHRTGLKGYLSDWTSEDFIEYFGA